MTKMPTWPLANAVTFSTGKL
jgi:hypothetical protein